MKNLLSLLVPMSDISLKELVTSTLLGLSLLAVVLILGYIYPIAQTAIAVAAFAGSIYGFLFCRHVYMKSLEDQ